jgi:hypothetical protein
MDNDNDVVSSRKLLMDFTSSEINTHGRMIVGFAVIILTLMQIKENLTSISSWQNLIIYFGIFATIFALWYLLMRQLAYGGLASGYIYGQLAPNSKESILMQLQSAAMHYIAEYRSRILIVFPTLWFIKSKKQKFGALTCVFLSIATTGLLYFLMG